MRCFWSTTTSILARPCGNPARTVISSRLQTLPRSGRPFSSVSCRRSAGAVKPAHPRLQFAVPEELRVPEPPSADGAPSVTSPTLTTAQLSRASAQTVRLCIQHDEIQDAFYVVKSLKVSNHKIPKALPSLAPPSPLLIHFGRPVPYRLAGHCLVHALIRRGLAKKAARTAHELMGAGIKLRPATIEACMHALRPPNNPHPFFTRPRIVPLPKAGNVLYLKGSAVSDPETRFAVKLLLEARRQGYGEWTRFQYIAALLALVKGELLAATLVYAIAMKAAKTSTLPEEPVNEDEDSPPLLARTATKRSLSRWGDDSMRTMTSITTTITRTLALPPDPDGKHPQYDAALQSLAILAALLNEGMIPAACLPSLLTALYSVPRDSEAKILIRGKKNSVLVRACKYFDQVIMDFINVLLGESDNRPTDRINLRTYNALIFYALRHRFSPALASRLLDHMTRRRSPPIQPDITTYNVIIRASTLARRNDFVELAIGILRGRSENQDSILALKLPDTQSTKDEGAILPIRDKKLERALHRYHHEALDVTGLEGTTSSSLLADAYTLSSYITHIAATGRAPVIAQILEQLLPELNAAKHPDWSALDESARLRLWREDRAVAARRAARLGPYFFVNVLNALHKTNRADLVERVWRLAKDAERASWAKVFQGQKAADPWCLPVHAYTIMLKCFADEARRGVAMQRRLLGKRHVNSLVSLVGQEYAAWIQRQEEIELARRRGRRLVAYMRRAGREVVHALLAFNSHAQLRTHSPHTGLPAPDARFFNAALALYGASPALRGRRSWRMALGRARRRYARLGQPTGQVSKVLLRLGRQMVRAGYAVPPALRPLFVGRWEAGTGARVMSKAAQGRAVRRAHVYPPPMAPFVAHRLKTVKTKGLPLPKRWRERPRGQRERTGETEVTETQN